MKQIPCKMSLKNVLGISLKLFHLFLLQRARAINELETELIKTREEKPSVHCLIGEEPEMNRA